MFADSVACGLMYGTSTGPVSELGELNIRPGPKEEEVFQQQQKRLNFTGKKGTNLERSP